MGHENRNVETEVRSEKVRKLLGEIPPSLIRWGTRGLGRNLHRASDGRLPDPPSIRKRRVYPDAYAALVFRPK